jgi:hypothetical protein
MTMIDSPREFATLDGIAVVAKRVPCPCRGCLDAVLAICGHLCGLDLGTSGDLAGDAIARRLFGQHVDACAVALLDQRPDLARALPVPRGGGRLYRDWSARVVADLGATLWLWPAAWASAAYVPRMLAERLQLVVRPRVDELEALGLLTGLRFGAHLRWLVLAQAGRIGP